MRVLALQYHDVTAPGALATSGFPGADADTYKMEAPAFAEHVAAVSAVVSATAVRATADAGLSPAGGAPPVLFTFDDGGVSALTHTAPILERAGWRGHFFVTTDRIGTPGFLSAEQIVALRRRGHVIGAHSCSHPTRMARCDDATLEREWRGSVGALQDILGEAVTTASVPGGYYSRRVAEWASRAGLRVLFTSEPTARVEDVDGCAVVGRFTLRRHSPAADAARLAAGDPRALGAQWMHWNAKKLAKRVAGDLYLRTRALLLRS